MDMNDYLTEERLGVFLTENMTNGNWIHDKRFITRNRPDYRNDFYKLIVEFDGYQHYTSAKRIIDDKIKDNIYESNDYKVIRIPYFIQLSESVIKEVFGIDKRYKQSYKHGFIDDKCILPCDFCEMGIEKFRNDIENTYGFLKDDIIESLKDKIEKLGNVDMVLPRSLQYLINV